MTTMGRRKLLPNINNLLLQLHLPHRNLNNGGEANGSKKVSENERYQHKATHHQHNTQQQHHHNLHIFTWPSLKRRASSSSLASNSEDEGEIVFHQDIHQDTETEPPSSPRTLEESYSERPISTTNDSIHSVNASHKSVVSFGNCEVRTYPQVLGDHPCCSEGCPIQLGWSYTSEESIKVDDYEREYHTVVNGQGEEASDDRESVTVQKYTVLHELRLTPEERRSILILSKQQEYVNATATANSTCDENDEQDGDTSSQSLTASKDSNILTTSPPNDLHDHERELIRECRRLNRCGGWNVNVKASRKRNKRNQEAFFGSPTGSTKPTTISSTTIHSENGVHNIVQKVVPTPVEL